MIRIAVNGALGRMGTQILNLAYKSQEFKIAAAFEHAKNEWIGKDLGQALGLSESFNVKLRELSATALKGCDVLIDFSSPEGTARSVQAAVRSRTALVIGTTGVTPSGLRQIREAGRKIAVLFSPNMSIGANFLFEIAALASERLKAGYDIEIVEAHHRLKKDAPSGTARRLAEVVARARGWDLAKAARFGRRGMTGERASEEIGIHVIRAGDIVGEHTAIFSGPGETIELTHRAQSRDAFARGALVAALFVSKKRKGYFTMADVLK